MAQIKGQNVIAPIVPFDTTDVHPSHEASYGKGGYRTVATMAERDAIPAPRREAGMLVFVMADGGSLWQLGADLATWSEFSAGVSSWNDLADKPSTFAPSAHGHTIAEVSGLSAALDGKQAAGSYAAATHGHVAADISDFTSAVIAAAPPTTNASLLMSGTLPDARLSANIARASDVTAAVAAVVDAAPESLNTLNELAAALGDDASFAATVTNSLAGKAPINNPTFTGTVSGVTAAMVGLGNVQNVDATARANHTGTQAASTITGLAAVATSGAYSDLSGRPSLGTASALPVQAFAAASHSHTVSAITDAGTAATRNVPATGNAGTTEVVLGSDTRLSNARTPNSHKSTHATGGTDALTPADIGAAASVHDHYLQTINPNVVFVDTEISIGDVNVVIPFYANSGSVAFGVAPTYDNDVKAQARTNLGLVAIASSGSASDLSSGTVPIARIPTGTTSATVCIGNDARLSDARTPTDGSVTTAKLANGSVTAAKIAATGTPSSSTFLRGDGAWADPIAEYDTAASFPAVGNAQALYIASDTGRQYQWTGSVYAEIGPDAAYVSAVDAGVLTGTAPRGVLPLASTSAVGAVQVGSGVNVSSGVISVTTSSIGAANASHQHNASDINAGTLDTARLPTNMISALNLYLWSNFR